METKVDQQLAKTAEKPYSKTPTLAQRFRLIKEKLFKPSEASMLWEDWRKILIEGWRTGINRESAPTSFLVSDAFLEVFQEMLPVNDLGIIDDKVNPEAAGKFRLGLEVARNLVVDAAGTKILVQKENGGIPEVNEEATSVFHPVSPSQIGALHTHPSGNGLPSSGDIANLLMRKVEFGIIITPGLVTAFFRTEKTPEFRNSILAQGYMRGMGESKKKNVGKRTGVWFPNLDDLGELNILCYQTGRGSKKFVRKDQEIKSA